MFKNHPKGLIPAALANMGERFGFYTMMAILVLFLMAKFGLDKTQAASIYSYFYFAIYILAFAGGLIADKLRNYKGTILAGIITMAVGYAIIAMPTPTPVTNTTTSLIVVCIGLFVIAFGNGLFKGNLQALVGQMYDNKEYSKLRDSGFSLFYMFINIGAIFAPFAAIGVRNWWVNIHGYSYNANLPELCHGHLNNTLTPEAMQRFGEMASQASFDGNAADLNAFANDYLGVFTTGFHYAFAVAIVAMMVSMAIFIAYKKQLPDPKNRETTGASKDEIKMAASEVRQRIWALIAVCAVVIFFWFSFHQNGLTLTFFAKDYTKLNLLGFDISAEFFQSMNPIFIVLLTPIVIAFFGWQRARGKETSTPGKIAIGMGIAALAFVVMFIGSMGMPDSKAVEASGGLIESMKASPYMLIGVYFILTIAELYISPLGISFVSKVSPPQYQGLMQGVWLGATAIGNKLLVFGAIFYDEFSQETTWGLFVIVCVVSMLIMFAMLGWLNRITK